MKRFTADPEFGSNSVVLIPDPSKLLDPIYLTAHGLVDCIPRPQLARLIPLLMRSTSAGDAPPVRDCQHPPDRPPPDIPPEPPPDSPPPRLVLRRLET